MALHKTARFEFDLAKDKRNTAEHGLSFANFDGFDEVPAVLIDDRFDYGEIGIVRSGASTARAIVSFSLYEVK